MFLPIPSAVVPPPPSAVIPPPPPSSVVPVPSAVVPPPPPTAVVPPPPPSAVVPSTPPSAVVPVPPPSAVVLPTPSAVVPPPSAVVPPPSVPPVTSVTFIPHPPPSASATTTLANSVPAKPSVSTATTSSPEIVPVQPISVEKWSEIEAKARTRIPDQTHTRYLHVDEVIRDNVGNLFVQSNYDVLTLLTNVVSSLQQFGRHDVCLMRNANNTAFTVMQHSAHGLYSRTVNDPSYTCRGQEDELIEQRRRETAYAIERINQAGSFYNSRLAELDRKIRHAHANSRNAERAMSSAGINPTVAAHTTQEGTASTALQTNVEKSVFEKTVYEKIVEKIARREHRRMRQAARRHEQLIYPNVNNAFNTSLVSTATSLFRRLPETDKTTNRKSSIIHDNNYSNNSSNSRSSMTKNYSKSSTLCNSYNGNYILNRYGRSYNPERSYTHYKRFGLPKVV